MKTEMEKAVSERDSLRKEVKELRLKLIESDETAEFYKTRVAVLIEQRVSKENSNSNSNSKPDSDGDGDATPPIPIPSSNKRTCKRKAVEYSATVTEEEEEAAAHNYNSAASKSKTQHHNSNQPKTPYIRVTGATSQITPLVNKITKYLNKENLEKFKESCLGHLLKINEVRFQGQLFLQLLLHMDMRASNKECLVFNINNSRLEFGPTEFSLVTGLRLCALEETTITTSSLTSSTQSKVFMGVDPTNLLENLDKDVLNVSRRASKGNDESALLKLALLHCLYGILLPGNPYTTIDEEYLHLIEDLHKFNASPWGRVAYEFLASSVLSARSSYDSSKIKIKICGFSLALQVWAYELMPSLAEYCAVRVNIREDQIPRILCWSTTKTRVGLKDLVKFFTPGDEASLVLDGIRASPWELQALTTGTIRRLEKEKSPSDKEQSHSAKPTSLTNRPARAMTQTNVNHVVQAETQPIVERCLSSAAGDVMIISDSEEDEAAAASNSQSKDSGDVQIGTQINLLQGLNSKRGKNEY